MSKPDGGPAFPIPAGEGWDMTGGMSLRDYFAGQALAGFCAETGTDIDDPIMARRAYELADVMIAEREK